MILRRQRQQVWWRSDYAAALSGMRASSYTHALREQNIAVGTAGMLAIFCHPSSCLLAIVQFIRRRC